jgi:hypothetical protein
LYQRPQAFVNRKTRSVEANMRSRIAGFALGKNFAQIGQRIIAILHGSNITLRHESLYVLFWPRLQPHDKTAA